MHAIKAKKQHNKIVSNNITSIVPCHDILISDITISNCLFYKNTEENVKQRIKNEFVMKFSCIL